MDMLKAGYIGAEDGKEKVQETGEVRLRISALGMKLKRTAKMKGTGTDV